MNSINTIKTGVVEGIGRNSFVTSVKPIFCGLYCHSCHRRRHVPYISEPFKGAVFFFSPLSIHVIQEFFSSNLCPLLRNCSPYETYYPFVLFQDQCAIRSG